MEVYLVRHGETGGNRAHRHQIETTGLTEVGIQQAAQAAELVKAYEPTHLVSSTLVRALETARIIGDTCSLIPETSNHFIELERPPYLYGNFHHSPQSLYFYLQWYLGKTKEGESYQQLRERIDQAKQFLSQYPEDARVVVVSHSVFINLFLAHMCYDKPINLVQATKVFGKILTTPNAKVTPVLFDPVVHANTCGWIQQ